MKPFAETSDSRNITGIPMPKAVSSVLSMSSIQIKTILRCSEMLLRQIFHFPMFTSRNRNNLKKSSIIENNQQT